MDITFSGAVRSGTLAILLRFSRVAGAALVGFGAAGGFGLAHAESALPSAAEQELRQALLPKDARSPSALGEEEPPHLTFTDAVEKALHRNPTILSAREEIKRAYALVEQARASSLPTLTAAATYLRLDADRVLEGQPGTPGRLLAGADQLAGSLNVAAPLLAPARWAQWLHAADSVKVVQSSAKETGRLLAIATARAYLAVVTQHRLVQVGISAREVAQAHQQFAAQRYHGGVGNRLDEVRAAQELSQSEAQLQSAYIALFRAREALGVLVAMDQAVDCADEPELPLPAELRAEAELGPDSAVPAAVGRLGEEALYLRGDLRLLQVRAWAAARLVRDSWVDYLPTLIGSLSPFYQNPPTLTQPLWGWQAQLALTLPLYDGGLRYGVQHERWALYNQAKLNIQQAQRQVRSEVRVAHEALRRAKQASAASRRAAELAAESVQLALIAYRSGATTNLEVVDAERRARDAALAAALEEDAVRQAHLDLLIASGYFPTSTDSSAVSSGPAAPPAL